MCRVNTPQDHGQTYYIYYTTWFRQTSTVKYSLIYIPVIPLIYYCANKCSHTLSPLLLSSLFFIFIVLIKYIKVLPSMFPLCLSYITYWIYNLVICIKCRPTSHIYLPLCFYQLNLSINFVVPLWFWHLFTRVWLWNKYYFTLLYFTYFTITFYIYTVSTAYTPPPPPVNTYYIYCISCAGLIHPLVTAIHITNLWCVQG